MTTLHATFVVILFYFKIYTSNTLYKSLTFVRWSNIYILPRVLTCSDVSYKLKSCSKKECCNQCRQVRLKGTMTESRSKLVF